MKRLILMLVLLAVSLAVLAQAVFQRQSWEFPRDDGPTLYIEVMPDGKIMLYEEDKQVGYKKFVGWRYLRCSGEPQ